MAVPLPFDFRLRIVTIVHEILLESFVIYRVAINDICSLSFSIMSFKKDHFCDFLLL